MFCKFLTVCYAGLQGGDEILFISAGYNCRRRYEESLTWCLPIYINDIVSSSFLVKFAGVIWRIKWKQEMIICSRPR